MTEMNDAVAVGRPVAETKKRGGERKPSNGKGRRNLEIFILSAPAIILFCCFVIFPIILGAYYGFYQWKGFGTPAENGKFVGLQNYIVALKDPNFQQAILHTFEIVIGSLVIQGPLAILFALLLNQKFKGRGLIRTLIFVPYVVSEVIVGTGWSLLLQKKGAVNQILESLGMHGVDWLADPKVAIWTLLLLISWKYIGFAVILMLAGMQSIPEELYEAAKVDGAGFWQIQKSITLPLLAPTLRIDDRFAAAVRFGLHYLGPVRFHDGRRLHDGHLHGPRGTRCWQLRIWFRRRPHHFRHLADCGADLPALCAQP